MNDKGGFARPRRGLAGSELEYLRQTIDFVETDERAAALLRRLLLDQVVNDALGDFVLDDMLRRLVGVATSALEAERGTVFLLDAESGELRSRVVQGDAVSEIRVASGQGIAGHVYTSGTGVLVDDAYADPHFFPGVDAETGYHTRSIACAPIFTPAGAVIGVTEILNKRTGAFDTADLRLLEAINAQAAATLDQARLMDHLNQRVTQDEMLLQIASDVSSDLRLDEVLSKIIAAASMLLDAERSTLFLHDPASDELRARLAEGADAAVVRVASGAGIAGHAFSKREPVIVADAYADARFDSSVDKRTGFRTRDLVCVPLVDRLGASIGVVQVLNKRHGTFGDADVRRLAMLASQVVAAIGNAQLMRDMLELRQHADAMMSTLSEGIIGLDGSRRVTKVSETARRILQLRADEFLDGPIDSELGPENGWLTIALDLVVATGRSEHATEVDLVLASGVRVPVNARVMPVNDGGGRQNGFLISLEDLSRERKLRATMSRYVAREVVDRAMTDGADPEQRVVRATVLFCDIRRFTTLTEAQSPDAITEMLNEYFRVMVQVIEEHGGALDKFIGDAIMAVFGAAGAGAGGAADAVRSACEMMHALRQLNAERGRRDLAPIDIGIGIASGDVVAGAIGGGSRLDYTVIGDSVNLAARLESATKQYGAGVLVDAATAELLDPAMAIREIDLVRVKGKQRPVAILEPLDHLPAEARGRLAPLLPSYADGLQQFRQRRWSDAIKRFREVLAGMPGDAPCWIHTDRCLYYRKTPPPDSWDGVWQMETK